jgi:hypothetical protein
LVRSSAARLRGVIAGVLVALVVTSLVAGCAGSVPGGSVTIVPPDRVVTAPPESGPSPAAGSPATGATGSAAPVLQDADGAARALRATGALIMDPELSYRVTATLIESYEPKPITTVFTAAVSGEDYRGSAKSGRNTVGFAYVGGQGWAKPNKDPWFHFAIHQMQADDTVRPWETLCWFNDLAYTGRPDEPADGYAFECPPGYQFQNRRLRSVGAHGRIDALTLVVDAAGMPVTLHVEGEHPSLAGRATPFTLDVRFQDVGKPTTIKAP